MEFYGQELLRIFSYDLIIVVWLSGNSTNIVLNSISSSFLTVLSFYKITGWTYKKVDEKKYCPGKLGCNPSRSCVTISIRQFKFCLKVQFVVFCYLGRNLQRNRKCEKNKHKEPIHYPIFQQLLNDVFKIFSIENSPAVGI